MAFNFRSSRAPRQQRLARAQPKFPRQRSVGQAGLARMARLAMVGLAVLGLLAFFLGGEDKEALVAEVQQRGPEPQAGPEPQIGVEARENINLAGITNPSRIPPASASGGSTGNTPPASVPQPPASGEKSGQNTPQPEIRLYAPAASREKALEFGNPWGIPYVGYPLEEIAEVLTKKYAPIKVDTGGVRERILGQLPKGSGKTLALTLGASDPAQVFDADLLALIRQEKLPVTLFVTSRWALANTQTLMALAQEPLVSLAGHGKDFRPCSVDGKGLGVAGATATVLELLLEVEGNARDMQRIASVRPRWFQGADNVYDRVALAIIRDDLGFGVAGHSLPLGRAEADSPEGLARALSRAKDRDIVYSPLGQTQGALAAGLNKALPVLRKSGFTFVPLPSPGVVK